MPWEGTSDCSVLLNGRELAKPGEWRFNVEHLYPADVEQLLDAVRKHLNGATGHFVVSGGAPAALLDAIRAQRRLTIRWTTSIGGLGRYELEAEIHVNSNLPIQPNDVVELFPFAVAGEVYISPSTDQDITA